MYSVGEVRERVRAQLVEERSMRRFIDGLRAATFVLRNPIPELPAAAPAPTGPEK
jgi:hypothetical protein